jgi:alpha-D-ribose 1-methylphosphonate 5-triphosphate diphosphatase PhnM
MDHKKNAMGVKRRLAILSMAACVALSGVTTVSGCGVRMGMEKVDEAKQAKKQAKDVQNNLEKKLNQGQED